MKSKIFDSLLVLIIFFQAILFVRQIKIEKIIMDNVVPPDIHKVNTSQDDIDAGDVYYPSNKPFKHYHRNTVGYALKLEDKVDDLERRIENLEYR